MSVPQAIKTVQEAAQARVSIRKYTDQPITNEEIEAILDLAGRAPSAYNVQPWRFIVVRNPEAKAQLQGAAYNQGQVGAAGALIVLTSDMTDVLNNIEEIVHPGTPEEKRSGTADYLRGAFSNFSESDLQHYGVGQSYIALGYLLLVLEAMGYGSSPMLGFDAGQVRKILGLGEHVQIPALVAFGHPAESGNAQHRHPVSRVIKYVD